MSLTFFRTFKRNYKIKKMPQRPYKVKYVSYLQARLVKWCLQNIQCDGFNYSTVFVFKSDCCVNWQGESSEKRQVCIYIYVCYIGGLRCTLNSEARKVMLRRFWEICFNSLKDQAIHCLEDKSERMMQNQCNPLIYETAT